MTTLLPMLALAAIAVASGFPVWLALAAYGGGWLVWRVVEMRKAR